MPLPKPQADAEMESRGPACAIMVRGNVAASGRPALVEGVAALDQHVVHVLEAVGAAGGVEEHRLADAAMALARKHLPGDFFGARAAPLSLIGLESTPGANWFVCPTTPQTVFGYLPDFARFITTVPTASMPSSLERTTRNTWRAPGTDGRCSVTMWPHPASVPRSMAAKPLRGQRPGRCGADARRQAYATGNADN